MDEKKINSWEELINIPLEFHSIPIIFRGVEKYEYELIPKIGREEARKKEVNKGEKPTLLPFDGEEFEKLMGRFKKESIPYIDSLPVDYSSDVDEDWMAIAQHHGAPTKLLDWTRSLFVAAYFACKPSGEINGVEYDAAIYGLKYKAPEKESTPIMIKEDVYIYFPNHFMPRITAQRSLFTVHNSPEEPLETKNIIKWEIPSDLCYQFKVALSKSGFDEASLFPDIDGLGSHLGWLYKWGRLD